MKNNLHSWKVGDPFSASHLQEVVDYANRTGSLIGGEGVVVTNGPNGTIIELGNSQIVANPMFCRVCATPTDGETFTDARYWVQPYLNSPSAGNTKTTRLKMTLDRVESVEGDGVADPKAFVAVNLPELTDASADDQHNVPVDTFVMVWVIRTVIKDDSENANYHTYYVFNSSPTVGNPQYVGMVYQGTAQNYAGWAYCQAVAMT